MAGSVPRREFAITPAGWRPFGVVALLAGAIAFGGWRLAAAPGWIALVYALLSLAVLAAITQSAYAANHARLVLTSEALEIRGDLLFARRIARDRIDAAAARAVDLESDADLRLKGRTRGIALPGYRAGWFRLAGGARAFATLTASGRVVCLPTHEDYVLLASVADADGFLEALRSKATG